MDLKAWRQRRPSKLAAGMNYTHDRRRDRRRIPLSVSGEVVGNIGRRGEEHANEVNTLMVRGTLDPLSSGLLWRVERLPCPCCGVKQNGKRRLNDRGRLYLRRLKRRRAN